MRELCGAHWLPERVLFSHAKPNDVVPCRRFFRAQCRFDSERTALLLPARLLEFRLADADPKQLRILQAQAQARDDFGLVFRLRRSLRSLLFAEAASGDEVTKLILRGSGFESVSARDSHRDGWNSSFERLADYLRM